MAEHEYTSVESMRGCMNILRAPNPNVFSRAHYMRILQTALRIAGGAATQCHVLAPHYTRKRNGRQSRPSDLFFSALNLSILSRALVSCL
jgi:hypothetical protein